MTSNRNPTAPKGSGGPPNAHVAKAYKLLRHCLTATHCDMLGDVEEAANELFLALDESEPAPPTDGPTDHEAKSMREDIDALESALAESRAEVERLRDRVRVLDGLVRKMRKFVPFEPWPDLTAEIDAALATQEPPAKEPTP